MRVRVRLELLLPHGLRRNHLWDLRIPNPIMTYAFSTAIQHFPTYRSSCLASAFSEQTVAKVHGCLNNNSVKVLDEYRGVCRVAARAKQAPIARPREVDQTRPGRSA